MCGVCHSTLLFGRGGEESLLTGSVNNMTTTADRQYCGGVLVDGGFSADMPTAVNE